MKRTSTPVRTRKTLSRVVESLRLSILELELRLERLEETVVEIPVLPQVKPGETFGPLQGTVSKRVKRPKG